MPSHVVLETLAASSAISTWRISGHSNVGHSDINAVPFGVSMSQKLNEAGKPESSKAW